MNRKYLRTLHQRVDDCKATGGYFEAQRIEHDANIEHIFIVDV